MARGGQAEKSDILRVSSYQFLADSQYRSVMGFSWSLTKVTDPHPKEVKSYIQSIKSIKSLPKDLIQSIVVVGNKSDEALKVLTLEGQQLATEYQCGYVELSARIGLNIETKSREVLTKIDEPTTCILQQGIKSEAEGKESDSPLGGHTSRARCVKGTISFPKPGEAL